MVYSLEKLTKGMKQMVEMQQPTTPAPDLKRRLLREVLDWLRYLVIALIAVFLLTTFVFQIVRVDGNSMETTLHDKEFMFVTKYQYLFGDPQRFDVVTCQYPDRGNTLFVKRIVGIPGDVVAVHGGVLYINGEAVEEPYLNTLPYYDLTETVVEEGHYFVLGDNRARSNDSHSDQVGQLARDQIVGKVRAIIWPVSGWRAIR